MTFRLLVGCLIGALTATAASAETPDCLAPTSDILTVVFPIGIDPDGGGDVFQEGDVVRALDPRGDCVGAMVWSQGDGRALVLRGDDVATPDVDGLQAGEGVTLTVESPSRSVPFAISTTDVLGTDAEVSFQPGAILIVTGYSGQAVDNGPGAVAVPPLTVSAPFPNPSPGPVSIRYATGATGTVEVEVVDVVGRRIARVDEGVRAAGEYTAQLSLGSLTAGVYLVRITAQLAGRTEVENRRLTIAR